MAPEEERAPPPLVSWIWTVVQGTLTLAGMALVGLFGWLLASVVSLREFAARGDRFTTLDAQVFEEELLRKVAERYPPPELVLRIENLSDDQDGLGEELKRLQLQIDRLEGHTPRSYTEDE